MPLTNNIKNLYQDFHYTYGLRNVDDFEVMFINEGYQTISFHLDTPGDGDSPVRFQGSTDGITYDNITFRQIGSDGYTQIGTNGENYIGSIVGLHSVKFVVASAVGSVSLSGSLNGRMTQQVSIMEGHEHGHPPHKIGYSVIHKGFNYTDSSTDTSLTAWTPAQNKRIVITDYLMTYLGSAPNTEFDLTVHDNSTQGNNPSSTTIPPESSWVYSARISTGTASSTNTHAYSIPWIASNVNGSIYIQITNITGGSVSVRGVLHGFEETVDVY